MTWLPHAVVLSETYRGFAPVRPYRVPWNAVTAALPFQPLPLEESWDDEETPLATEAVSCR